MLGSGTGWTLRAPAGPGTPKDSLTEEEEGDSAVLSIPPPPH